MSLPYQTRRHLDAHMRQWPHHDKAEVERDIRRMLLAGTAWLWPEPTQLELPL